MQAHDALVAVYATHDAAEAAIRDVAESGMDMKHFSIIGRGYHTDEAVTGFYSVGDRIKHWGSRGAYWGGLWGLLFGGLMLTIPVVGPVYVLGAISAAVFAALGSAAETYSQKLAAEQAALRVRGVKAVAEEIEVRLPFERRRDDGNIAAAAIERLAWSAGIPTDRFTVQVENGWVTLTGAADWFYQKEEAGLDVRRLLGVVGLTNHITVKPGVDTSSLSDDINHSLHRSWFFDGSNLPVSAQGGRVHLTGTVGSPQDRQTAAATAWSAPGATDVINDITVS
jgi:osmotically-inducible protein OsmY